MALQSYFVVNDAVLKTWGKAMLEEAMKPGPIRIVKDEITRAGPAEARWRKISKRERAYEQGLVELGRIRRNGSNRAKKPGYAVFIRGERVATVSKFEEVRALVVALARLGE